MASINLTPRELEVLKVMSKYIKTEAVDWAAVAAECKFNSAKRARDRWYPIRDKLFGSGIQANSTSDAGDAAAPKTPKKSSTAKKSAGMRNFDDVDDDEETPTSKKGKRGKKEVEHMPDGGGDENVDAKVKAELVEDDDDDVIR